MSNDRDKIDVLIVGGGGREHALAWKCAKSPRASRIFVAPGNAGTAREPGITNIDISAEDIPSLLAFAKKESIGLTIVGPEAPLVDGIVDTFERVGLRCFGPNKMAARLEGSKAYTKDFLARHDIPTAAYGVFDDPDEAIAAIASFNTPLVVKADGLAAGKGVVIAQSRDEAIDAARSMLVQGLYKDAGATIVVEEFLHGEEASFICAVDGVELIALATSQDHKARDEGDRGPNTGGMGAYSPAPVVTDAVNNAILDRIIRPTLNGLKADGVHYTGFLYAGVMIDDAGNPRVLEFNCRFGDPETQPIMMRLKSDFIALLNAALDHTLDEASLEWDERMAVGVVMAAGGYPESYQRGDVISGLDTPETNKEDIKVFHAGTRLDGEQVVTNGGRVLCVTALGNTVTDATKSAYAGVDQINWSNAWCRKDIAFRAVAREKLLSN